MADQKSPAGSATGIDLDALEQLARNVGAAKSTMGIIAAEEDLREAVDAKTILALVALARATPQHPEAPADAARAHQEFNDLLESQSGETFTVVQQAFDLGMRAATPQHSVTEQDEDENVEADAYMYACDLMEQFQRERAERGVEIGTQGSLCDGLAWLYAKLKELETRAQPLASTAPDKGEKA